MELRDFALQILCGDTLADKLVAATAFTDHAPLYKGALPQTPHRPAALSFGANAQRIHFPTLTDMETERGRAVVFHFFANHELLALELMALALLRFPQAEAGFRHGIARTMVEEQQHLQAYLQRMQTLGLEFGAVPVNDFFWRCLSPMTSPAQYCAGLSLTFEQANLDFSWYYQQQFTKLGDAESVAIMQKVFTEEIGHVKHGLTWFNRWKPSDKSQWQWYQQQLQFPLTPARGKAMIFVAEARQQAGFDQEFMQNMLLYPEAKAKPASLFWYNPDCEWEIAAGSGYKASTFHETLIRDFAVLPWFVAQEGDVILVPEMPSASFRQQWVDLGLPRVYFEVGQPYTYPQRRMSEDLKMADFVPWGFSPRAWRFYREHHAEMKTPLFAQPAADYAESLWPKVFAKTELPAWRQTVMHQYPELIGACGAEWTHGQLLSATAAILSYRDEIARDFKLPVVVKIPYSAAGQATIRILPGDELFHQQLGWLEKMLARYKALLVEPWLPKVLDLSWQFVVRDESVQSLGLTRFITDPRGQYLGHVVGQPWQDVDASLRKALFSGPAPLLAAGEKITRAFVERLRAQGFRGPCGVDAIVFADPNESGRWRIQPLGELNARLTMGRLALSLQRFITAGQPAIWGTVGAGVLKKTGYRTLADWFQAFHTQYPLQLQPETAGSTIRGGVIATTPVDVRTQVVSVLAVGEAAGALNMLLSGTTD